MKQNKKGSPWVFNAFFLVALKGVTSALMVSVVVYTTEKR